MVPARSTRGAARRLDLVQILAIALIALVWLAGGASRGDVLGQVVVRAGCWAILIAAVLAGPRPMLGELRPVLLIMAGTIALPLLQLVPLPPSLWQALPGRAILAVPGEPLGWRPWTMTPAATVNALSSLVVPATALILLAQGGAGVRRPLAAVLVIAVALGVGLGLLQFSGAGFDDPFVNDTPGQVSSIFANRNHFALFVAIGCLVAPVWAFEDRDRGALRWRGPLAAGLVLLFLLTILATGSRGGMVAGALAVALSMALIGRRLRRRLRHLPKWAFPAIVGGGAIIAAAVIAISIVAGRASAVDRAIGGGLDTDMRSRALPTVLSMIRDYMPLGSGFGGFDPVFRLHEPMALLKLTYFNQAHNDFLGIALDGGIVGLALLAGAILWWGLATWRVWRAADDDHVMHARLGSAIVALVLVASAADYPARTPLIMLVLAIAGFWLSRGAALVRADALPRTDPRL